MEQPIDVLKKYFGYNKFRPFQEDVITKLINGENVSLIMPTGGGKSLCFQIPSIVREGVGIIISPLIALMQDQVNVLNRKGIKSVFINSTIPQEERGRIRKEIENDEYDLLYVSPEMLLSYQFYNWLKTKVKIALVAIDESHCVSKWGHDFRPNYLQLSCFKLDFPDVPRIALTATANEYTRNEILFNLGIEKENEFITGFDRPNITYTIAEKESDEYAQLIRYLNKNHKKDSGVVYCSSKKRTEDVARKLREHGFNAVHYHAKVDSETKLKILNRFLDEDDIIVVATIAFGMGIDKPNVRFVVHMNLPSSIEAYYQETGRAGRDGLPADAYMIYSVSDVIFRQELLSKSIGDEEFKAIEGYNLETMFSLCEVSECRRKVLINYFGDELKKPCGNCDNCLSPPQSVDGTILAQKALSVVFRTGQRFGVVYNTDVLMGVESDRTKELKHDQLSVYGIGKDTKKAEWHNIFRQLLVLGYLKLNPMYKTLYISEKGAKFLKEKETIKFPKRIVSNGVIKRGHTKQSKINSFNLQESMTFSKLKSLRMDLSKSYRIRPYEVFNDDTLVELIIKKPRDLQMLRNIEGMSFSNVRSYGEEIIEIINNNL